jgi:hypothetical protein
VARLFFAGADVVAEVQYVITEHTLPGIHELNFKDLIIENSRPDLDLA